MAKQYDDLEQRRDFTSVELGFEALRHVGHTVLRRSRPGLGPHVHPKCFEICYLRDGQMHWWNAHREQDAILNPGEMYISYPDEVHGGVDDIHEAGDLYWMSVEITNKTLQFTAEQQRYLDTTLRSIPRHFSAPKVMPMYFEHILETISNPGPLAAQRLRTAVTQILLTCVDAGLSHCAEPQREAAFERVIDAVKREPALYKQVDDLAAIAGLSSNRFINRFRAYTGYSPMDYVNREKIHVAKRLLSDPNVSVTDIAMQLDYSSTQYFATTFKKYTGMTPSQFRSESFR